MLALRRAPRGWSRKDWFPFDEARAITRTLGLRSAKEWFSFHRQNRKSMARIPQDPARVYKDTGYTDYYDWLNFERHPPPAVIGEGSTKLHSIHVNSKGAHLIKQILSAHEPLVEEKIELFAMPHESRFTFLYRKAGGSNSKLKEIGESEWVPLSVRVSGRATRPQFGHAARCCDHPIVCVDLYRERFFVFPPDSSISLSFEHPFYLSRTHEAQFGVSAEDLPAVLRRWWESDSATEMKKSCDIWLRESIESEQSRRWLDFMLRLKEVLYEPLGLCLEFSHNSRQAVHNSFLNEVPAFHLMAEHRDPDERLFRLERRTAGPARIAFADQTKLGYAICGVRRENHPDFAGIFFFPREALLERGILGSGTEKGRPVFSVFPPFGTRTSRFKRSRDAKVWQEEFYIDLSESTPDRMDFAREQLKTILSRYSAGALRIN